jgi:opacity protein-like surface antigen
MSVEQEDEMKKLTIVAVGLLLLIPSLAFSDSISLRLGYFWPKTLTDSYLIEHPDSLLAIEFGQMSFIPKDYKGGMVGIGYDHFLTKYISLAISGDAYNKSSVGYYMDWVVNTLTDGDFAFPFALYEGGDIVHSLRVSITPVDLSLKFLPLGRRAKIIPYVGGGASLVFYGVRMFGDMINFAPTDINGDPIEYFYPDLSGDQIYPVEPVASRDSGIAFGWHAFGGIQFPIGYRATIEAEARYHAARGRLNGLFEGFDDLELSGLTLTAGISYWF